MLHVTPHDVRIPALGLGTFGLNGDVATKIVDYALAIGYRHVDTAQMYGNEAEVGAGIMGSAVPRDEIWLTTKIWPDKFPRRRPARCRPGERAPPGHRARSAVAALADPDVPLAETVGALNEARRRGYAQHIGISNFPSALIREAVGHSEAPLLVNQVEYHPYLDQSVVLAELARHGMALTAYSPVGRGKVFKDPTLQQIGAAHGKNAGQVTLRWLLQQGVTAIPRSTREANVAANLDIFDFALSDDEMARISGLARPDGRMVKPADAPDWD